MYGIMYTSFPCVYVYGVYEMAGDDGKKVSILGAYFLIYADGIVIINIQMMCSLIIRYNGPIVIVNQCIFNDGLIA